MQVFIHGGYWQELSKNESTFAGARFVENGFAFAAIDYTLAPAATIDDMINQCCASIQWLYQNSEELGFDRHKIFLSGSSAGAHLASMVLLTCWSSYGLPADCIKGVALMSGIYDLRPISHTYINEPLQMDEAKAKELSPLFKDLTAMPPAIICWGEYETDEFKRQSRDFSWALQNSGNKVETFEVAAVNHFDIVHTLAEKDATLGRRVYAQMS
ncbi:MAG: alpha/beta hydrolase [Pseudomonadota bacterium]